MNNLYSFVNPNEVERARRQRGPNSVTPFRCPVLHFRIRTSIGLLVIGLCFGIPSTMAITSPAITDPCSNGTYFVPTGYGSVSPGGGTIATTFTLTATMTGCGVSGTVDVTWYFGDGVTLTVNGLAPVTHIYKSGGLFTWSFSWHFVAGSMGPPSPPGANGPYSGTLSVDGHWTNGDWSIERSQTIQCVYQTNGAAGHWCMSWRAQVKADGQETNLAVDYYQAVFRAYLENNTDMSVWNLDASISFATPSPGGVDTLQPGPQTRVDQTFLTLSDPASFLSVSVWVPSQQIDCLGCNLAFTHWHIWSPIACGVTGDCFNSGVYEEQGVDVALPEGQAWSINFHFNTNAMNFPVKCQTSSGTPNLTACNFTWDGTINIPGGHQDPTQQPPCCFSSGGGGGGIRSM